VKRIATSLRHGLAELWGLVVDDGLLAASVLVGVGVVAVLTRSDALGPSTTVGWGLVAWVALAVLAAVRRALRQHGVSTQE
jgi:hypothetical protein